MERVGGCWVRLRFEVGKLKAGDKKESARRAGQKCGGGSV